MQAIEIVFATVGTYGDVAPFLGLAEELTRRGFATSIMTSSDHETRARDAGVPFICVAAPDWPQIGRDDHRFFQEVLATSYPKVFAAISQKVSGGNPILLVCRTGHFAALFAAERYRLPVIRIALQPCAIRRTGHPVSPDALEFLNGFRKEHGLTPLDGRNGIEEPSLLTLSLFPSWFGAPQSNWRQSGKCIGFPSSSNADGLVPPALSSLIEDGRNPVVFSMGSGVQEVTRFLDAAKSFCTTTKLPVVFLSRYASSASTADLPEGMQIHRYVEHSALLPRALAVVHNGGIGTVAQCLRAGVPQIIVPMVYDQPDNAQRVEQLGAGRALELGTFGSENLLNAYRILSSDSSLPTRLRKLAGYVRRSNSAKAGADEIEALICKNGFGGGARNVDAA